MKISMEWNDFKVQLDKGLSYRYFDVNNMYHIYAVDGNFDFECLIVKDDGSSQTDFETNYKNNEYSTFGQFDSDGAQIIRQKAARKGWTYAAIPFEVKTSELQSGGSLYSKLVDNTDRSGFTAKIYDNNDAEITTAGILNANLATAVKTVIDFEPTYDYEVIGGALRIEGDLTQDVRLWIIAVPDIPADSGGSKEMCGGINLRALAPQNEFKVDGRVSKLLSYNSTYHTNKLRFILKYPPGLTTKIYIVVEIYRQ